MTLSIQRIKRTLQNELITYAVAAVETGNTEERDRVYHLADYYYEEGYITPDEFKEVQKSLRMGAVC